jgi:RNA polymerase sigma factor (sigma-70 family)
MSTINFLPIPGDDERTLLFKKYGPVAIRIARAWGSTEDTREEAEAECLLHLVELLDSTPQDKITEPFVAASLRNRLRTIYRSNRDNRQTESLDALDERIGFDVADHRPDPEAEYIDKEELALASERREHIRMLLPTLPQRQQRLLTMLYGLDGYDPKSMAEVARSLKISRVTAYSDLEKAMETLRSELAALGYEPAALDVREVLRAAA